MAKLLPLHEAARSIGQPTTRVRQWIREGRLHKHLWEGKPCVERTELERVWREMGPNHRRTERNRPPSAKTHDPQQRTSRDSSRRSRANIQDGQMLRLKTAAKQLDIPRSTLEGFAAAGRVPTVRKRGRQYIRAEDMPAVRRVVESSVAHRDRFLSRRAAAKRLGIWEGMVAELIRKGRLANYGTDKRPLLSEHDVMRLARQLQATREGQRQRRSKPLHRPSYATVASAGVPTLDSEHIRASAS